MTASVSPPLVAVRRAVGMAALTAWITASLRGGGSADDLMDAADQVGLRRIRTSSDCQSLIVAMAQLRASGLRCATLILPAPGDVAGLPGPAGLNQRALAGGAAVVITGGEPASGMVLLPADDADWPLYEVPLTPAVVAQWPSVRSARAEFAQGIAGHSAALAELDVAGDALGLRDQVLDADGQPLPHLPPDISDERRELLGRARLVAFLAAAASSDDGSAVSAAEASSRSAHLRSLAAIARRAIAASVSGP